MNIIRYDEINRAAQIDPAEYAARCSDEYDQKCLEIARAISAHADEHPLILLAGPSGSGKTTTAHKIEYHLDNIGITTHTISMDDYFLPKHLIQVFDENNQIDYESPYRIDIELLQEHMRKIAKCEPVEIPYFDFKTQDRLPGRIFERRPGDLVLFEGIHALNPKVTDCGDIASCIYVSVRTRIQLSDGELIHPEFIRLMRRIIRDRNFRGRSPAETLDMYDSVQRGEHLYILPYKYRAHYHLDTFHGFEASLYKSYLFDDFAQLKHSYNNYQRFSCIERLMNELVAVSPDSVPPNALSREFIGELSLTRTK